MLSQMGIMLTSMRKHDKFSLVCFVHFLLSVVTVILQIIPGPVIQDLTTRAKCLYTLTQVQRLAQWAQSLQYSQLQFVGHGVSVDGSGLGADRSLSCQRGAQLGQNLFRNPPPQEVATFFAQRTQHLAERLGT